MKKYNYIYIGCDLYYALVVRLLILIYKQDLFNIIFEYKLIYYKIYFIKFWIIIYLNLYMMFPKEKYIQFILIH